MGKATAIYFQQKGWNVIATMRNPDKDTELNQLENVTVLPLDVTDLKQIEIAVSKAIAIHPVDVVYNNAGYGLMGALEALSDDQLLREINTNLLGVIRVTQAFIPHFREKKSGVFVSTTSMGGLLAFPLHSIYHAAKFGVQGWSESMSFELGLHNIRIKTVAPGAVNTDFLGRSLDKALHPAYKELEDKLFAATESMMSQGVQPERIAEVVYEAATDDNDQVTYIATDDAKAAYERRLEIGSEASRIEIRKQILGN